MHARMHMRRRTWRASGATWPSTCCPGGWARAGASSAMTTEEQQTQEMMDTANAASTAFVVPCLTTLVAGYGETHQKVNTQQTIKTCFSILTQGIVTGVFRSLGALGRAAGPIFGSFLYWSLGPELSYAIGGFGLLIPYFMLRRLS